MGAIKLKKILFKKEESVILRNTISFLGIPIIIKNKESEVLFEFNKNNYNLDQHETIIVDDIILGFVYSNEKYYASNIKELILYFINNENEKKALACEVLNKYRELELLYNLSEKISAWHDIEDIAKIAIEESIKYINASYAVVMLENDDTHKLEIYSEYSRNSELKEIINPKDGIIKSTIEKGYPEIINDVEADQRYIPGNGKIKSMICAPIIIKGQALGVVVLCNKEKIEYKSEDLKLFNAIVFQSSISIENAKLYLVLENTFFQTVKALAETIEMRDPYTGGHIHRVMDYSIIVGEKMGLSKRELTRLKLAALMHDIGKIGIGDNILQKNEDLTDNEYLTMRKHTEYGSDILKNIRQLDDIIPGVRSHHERYDGTGYPDSLRGEDIPLIARIIAVADSFDAMTTDRPYKKALNTEEALSELKLNAGTQFDSDIVKVFLKIF